MKIHVKFLKFSHTPYFRSIIYYIEHQTQMGQGVAKFDKLSKI